MERETPSIDDPSGYVGFVDTHTPQLLRVAFLLCADDHAAQDLVQETLLQSYRRWSRVQQADNQAAYVRRILVNVYLMGLRRKRFAETPLESRRDYPSQEGAESRLAEYDAVLRAISRLSHREQIALVMRFYEDLDDQSIATALRCRPGTVRSLVHRGLEKLRSDPTLHLQEDAPIRSE